MRLPTMTTRHLMIAVAVAAVALTVQGAVIGMALLVLIRAARRPHPVHPATAILLTLLTGILLWANLRPNQWLEEFGGGMTPEGLDPITEAMFYRGWPLSPCMFCLFYFMKFHASSIQGCVLAFDGILFVIALYATKAACEGCLRWLQYRNLGIIARRNGRYGSGGR